MSEVTCSTCPWCGTKEVLDGYGRHYRNDSVCRKAAPFATKRNPQVWPVINPALDWCGEHPSWRDPAASTYVLGEKREA